MRPPVRLHAVRLRAAAPARAVPHLPCACGGRTACLPSAMSALPLTQGCGSSCRGCRGTGCGSSCRGCYRCRQLLYLRGLEPLASPAEGLGQYSRAARPLPLASRVPASSARGQYSSAPAVQSHMHMLYSRHQHPMIHRMIVSIVSVCAVQCTVLTIQHPTSDNWNCVISMHD